MWLRLSAKDGLEPCGSVVEPFYLKTDWSRVAVWMRLSANDGLEPCGSVVEIGTEGSMGLVVCDKLIGQECLKISCKEIYLWVIGTNA